MEMSMAKNNKNHPVVKQFYSLMEVFLMNGDIGLAKQALELIHSEQLTVSPRNDGQWTFMAHSKYPSKCQACNNPYMIGDAVFICNRKGWHPGCAPEEAKSPMQPGYNIWQKWAGKQKPVETPAQIVEEREQERITNGHNHNSDDDVFSNWDNK
jgi:hypothetical protein